MSAAETSAQAIAALLTGLARAVADAQEAMADLPAFDAFGRPLPVYQIPSLDFTFEIEAFEEARADGRPSLIRFGTPGPQAPRGGVQSHISGRLVAVPPNGGLPQTRIVVTREGDTVTLTATDALGARLSGQAMELEIDVEATRKLYGTTLTGQQRLNLLSAQRLVTDDAGAARVAVAPDVLGATDRAIIVVRGAGAETRLSLGRDAP